MRGIKLTKRIIFGQTLIKCSKNIIQLYCIVVSLRNKGRGREKGGGKASTGAAGGEKEEGCRGRREVFEFFFLLFLKITYVKFQIYPSSLLRKSLNFFTRGKFV